MNRSTDTLQLHDWHEFAVTSRREITALLRNICAKKARILVAVGGQPVTWVTGLDCDADTLILERSLSREQNHSIAKARHVALETTLENIRILFDTSQVRETEYQGNPAFEMDLPSRVVRLQRRDFYRVATPIIDPVLVSVPLAKAQDGATVFSLSDISCGGIGLVDNQMALDATIGRTFTKCRIDLPEVGVITTGLQIRNTLTTTLTDNRTNRRLGCQFVDISSAHLSMVQRYVTKRECEHKRRSGD